MLFRLDQLGKHILRDFFGLVGTAETEVEVPVGDAQRIDVWHVPNPDLLEAHPELEPGLLRSMAAEPGIVELWSAAPGINDFYECVRKHHQWRHGLTLRAGSWVDLPWAWLVSAGRPDSVLREFGFELDTSVVASGLYTTAARGWRIHIIVISELPRVRGTLLLRLLGSARARRMALRELSALPEDAWERRVAFPWLIRLSFEVPAEVVAGLPAEERELIVETREWYEQFNARRLREAMQEALPKAVQEALPQAMQEELSKAKESWKLQMFARLCGRRLGRSITEAEQAALAEHLHRLGEERVEDMLLASSTDALSAWLADPNAT